MTNSEDVNCEQARKFWGADYDLVMAIRQETQQVVKSTITAEDIAVFEAERKRLAQKVAIKQISRKYGYVGRDRGYFGTCWECGCHGYLDSEGYCGC